LIRIWLEPKPVSIHAARGGRDLARVTQGTSSGRFQSTRPVGAATLYAVGIPFLLCFNPRGPWGPRLHSRLHRCHWYEVSIHAARGGRDTRGWSPSRGDDSFNPRGPWGPRPSRPSRPHSLLRFNPRGPWGPRHDPRDVTLPNTSFNPRGPWGPRQNNHDRRRDGRRFQSTRPVGAATPDIPGLPRSHPRFNPRGPWGPRPTSASGRSAPRRFNPRGPWGPRRAARAHTLISWPFQSTRPVGAATPEIPRIKESLEVSIHAARGGRDSMPRARLSPATVSIHAARGGRDKSQRH